MIRVLQIMDSLGINTGVSSFVLNIYRHIDREQVQFDFLVSNYLEDSYEAEIMQYGGKIVYTGNPLSLKTAVESCRNSKKFLKFHAGEYVAVHLHSPTKAEMTVRYAKKYGIKNIIVHSHSSMFSDNWLKNIIHKVLLARLASFATHYWYCSDKAGEFLFGEDFRSKPNSQWIKNGINVTTMQFDVGLRKIVREKYRISNCKVACHISNFTSMKNVGFLLEIVKKVTEHDSSWRFLFVGDGLRKSWLERNISLLGLSEKCIFIGLSNAVSEFLNAADVFLLPSIAEGLPVVAIEAQASGLPCFLSDAITREADVGNAKYLQLKYSCWVEALLELKIDSEEQRRKKSFAFTNSVFNIKTEAKRVEGLYKEMV